MEQTTQEVKVDVLREKRSLEPCSTFLLFGWRSGCLSQSGEEQNALWTTFLELARYGQMTSE
jgi:hypothetical protein